jgi:3',5'-cyclic AMP phosphodiesterase CpdA
MFLFILISLINFTFAKTTIMVISDLNGSYGSVTYANDVKKAVEFIVNEKPDLVISTGDMVAGQKANLNYNQMWQAFHDVVTTPLKSASIPFAVTPGNHDGSGYAAFVLEREIFKNQWPVQEQNLNFVDNSNYPLFYAFTLNNILFISLDATKILKLDQTQMQWLEQLLTQNGKYKTKVVFGHMPLFPVAQNREQDYLGDSDLRNLLKKHKITLYLSGHHHAFYPGVEDSIHQVSQACLGGGPRKLIGDTLLSPKSITRIDFQDDGTINIDAYLAPDFKKVVNKSALPKRINNLIRF